MPQRKAAETTQIFSVSKTGIPKEAPLLLIETI